MHEKDTGIVDETYFDASTFEWLEIVENNSEVIINELKAFVGLRENGLEPYFSKTMMNAPDKWKSVSFYFWGVEMSRNAIGSCPRTISLLKSIPNLISASISILEPHAEIKPHYGDTDAIYRCHLGLDIPAGIPTCGFRVGYEDRSWEKGKLLIFNDAAYHKAWNYTDRRRVILLFDVIRPEYSERKRWICAKVRGNILWQYFSEKMGVQKNRKNFITISISLILGIGYFFLFSTYLKSDLLK